MSVLKANFKFKENVFNVKLACNSMMELATIALRVCITLIMGVINVQKVTASTIINAIFAPKGSTSTTMLVMIAPKENTTMT